LASGAAAAAAACRSDSRRAERDIERGSAARVLEIQLRSSFQERADEGFATVHALMQECGAVGAGDVDIGVSGVSVREPRPVRAAARVVAPFARAYAEAQIRVTTPTEFLIFASSTRNHPCSASPE
jgi:hypothetical protein